MSKFVAQGEIGAGWGSSSGRTMITNAVGQLLRPCTLADLSVGATVWCQGSVSGFVEGFILCSTPQDGRVEVELPGFRLNKHPSMSNLYVIHPVTQPMAETSASEAVGSVTQPMAGTTGTGTPSC